MKANELDKRFDEGEDISEHLDFSKAKRPKQEQKRINVDFPLWMIHSLDKESKRLGIPYGTGHGKAAGAKGLTSRHAKLAVGTASTLAVFLAETHNENPRK